MIIEKRGYTVVERPVSADPTKLFVLAASMSQQSFLGWVEITSNVPGADIFIDDKSVGAVGRTPLSQNIKPGKHTFWISADGYDEYHQEVDVIPDETHSIKAKLKGSPVGKINVTGLGIEDATIMRRRQALVRARAVPQEPAAGRAHHHRHAARLQAVHQAHHDPGQDRDPGQDHAGADAEPQRRDHRLRARGRVRGGGICARQQGERAIATRSRRRSRPATRRPDSNDPRFTNGKLWAIGADAAFAVAGITALTAVYYTFREKGAPSTGLIDVRALALRPEIGPGYAGIGMGVSW